ncbi:MAG: alginate export family protein, partial [Methylophilaceae bacterium]
DYSGGDDRIDAYYYKLGGGVGIDNFSIRADHETLSSNDGKYAFQTPFGTNHLFQGWVDKFLTTPKEGIKDNFVTATYKYGDFLFYTDFHVFSSDKDFNQVGGGKGDNYGKEWNAAVTYNYSKNIMTKLEYGKYTEDDQYRASATANAAGRIRDTEKLWLTAMYTF